MTRDRITYLVIGALLTMVGIWIARNTYWVHTTFTTPLEGEAASNPYYSVQHLAAPLGIRTGLIVSLGSAPPHQGVLLVDGFQDDLAHTQVDALAPWVESGGRLIITDDVVLSDPKFQTWSGISRGTRFYDDADEDDDEDATDKDKDRQKDKGRERAKRKFVRRDLEDDCAPLAVSADGNPTGRTLTLCIVPTEFGFVSKRKAAWSLANDFGLQVLRVNVGRGSVTVIPRHALISNRNLIRHDHAEIFISAASLRRGDSLYILNVSRAETLIALIWRLAAPALVFFAAAIFCIILRALPRFGPATPAPAMVRRSLAEQIRANAAFAWRTRKLAALRAAVRRALDETAKKRIASYGGLDVRKRVNALAAWTGIDAKTLNSAMTEDAVAAPHIQRAAIALLEQTRRILNTRTLKQ